ncbi:unnamed protein product, partial [Chrysoparadoxa australica]
MEAVKEQIEGICRQQKELLAEREGRNYPSYSGTHRATSAFEKGKDIGTIASLRHESDQDVIDDASDDPDYGSSASSETHSRDDDYEPYVGKRRGQRNRQQRSYIDDYASMESTDDEDSVEMSMSEDSGTEQARRKKRTRAK